MSDLKDEIYKACKNGNITAIKNFITSSNNEIKDDISVVAMVLSSIQNDQFETFKFIIDSGFKNDDLYDDYSINAYLQAICIHSIENRLDFFKYAFLHPKIRKNEDDFMEQSLRFCTLHGVIEVFQYLCENFPNSKALYRSLVSGSTLISSATNGSINIIDYVLDNEELNKDTDIHIHKDHPFRGAYESKQYDVINHLIYNRNIDITPELKEYIQSKPDLLHMFEMREVSKDLENKLKSNKKINKKPKI